jgi:hypothetical protein
MIRFPQLIERAMATGVLLAMLSCASGDKSVPTDWKWFSNDFYNLRLAHPPDWTPRVTTWGNPPDEGDFVVVLDGEVVIRISPVIDPNVTFDSLRTLIRPGKIETDVAHRWHVISDCEDTVLGKNKARSAISTDQAGLRSTLIAIELDKQPYVLTILSEKHFDTALQVLATLSRPPN